MSTREQYRGMSIRSIARPFKDGSGWTSEVLVAEEIGSDTSESRFGIFSVFIVMHVRLHRCTTMTTQQLVQEGCGRKCTQKKR